MQIAYSTSFPAETSVVRPLCRLRLWLLLPALVLPTIAALLSNVFFPGTKLGNGSYLAIKFFLLTWPLVSVGWILRERLKGPFSHRDLGRSLVTSIAVGLGLLAALVIAVKSAPIAMLLMKQASAIAMGIVDKGVAMHYVAFALTISIVHAGLEEFFWRWYVFGQMRRIFSKWWAHGLAAMAFAAHHFVILGGLFPLLPTIVFGMTVALAGFLWSLLYERYGSLVGPWISHMIIDLGLMWVGWLALQEVAAV